MLLYVYPHDKDSLQLNLSGFSRDLQWEGKSLVGATSAIMYHISWDSSGLHTYVFSYLLRTSRTAVMSSH